MEADPWQRDLLAAEDRRILVCCSRQIGKSRCASAKALCKALLDPPAMVLIVSRALRQSAELLRKVRELYKALQGGKGLPPPRAWSPQSLKGEVTDYDADLKALTAGRFVEGEEAVQDSVLSMEFANGSRIISLPSTADTIVGYSAVDLLIIDEAAKTLDTLYYSLRPMLLVSKGQLVALSSPFGKRGWFWEAWDGCDKALLRGEAPAWRRVKVKASECPRVDPGWLEREKEDIGDRWYRQEYCCSFEDTVDAFFSGDDIDALLSSRVKPLPD
jgi:hypothetical protein